MSPSSLCRPLSVCVHWRLKFPHHTCACWTLDQDWLPNYLWCYKSCHARVVKSDFHRAQRNFSIFYKEKSEHSLNTSNCSYIILHCDTHKTQHRKGKKKKTVLTGGDFKHWAIKQRIIKYPADLLEHFI